MAATPSWLAPALQVFVPAVLLVTLGVIWSLDRPRGAWAARLRARFLLGVPWGTVVSVSLVLAVYLLPQRGLWAWQDPLTLPFVSWSYLYPTGWLLAAFSHSGVGHLVGNLVGAALLAPIAEYAWGHYPTERGSSSFASLRTNPYVRAFLLFPLAVVLVGVATASFHWGPLIGFSGVVYALAGFALVRYPIAAVVALSARSAVRTTYYSVLDPVVRSSPSSSFGGPWWAGVAVQGHLLGLLLGVLLGVAVLARRPDERTPSALRIWTGALLVSFTLTLWAVWWYGPGDTYVLYRGLGVGLVVALAAVVATAVARSRDRVLRFEPGNAAALFLVAVVLSMGLVAVPVNLSTIEGAPPDARAVEVRDYTVYYGEGVTNQQVPAFNVSVLGSSSQFTTSGVIVTNPDRHIWTREVSPGRLAYTGTVAVQVGDVGWSETVLAQRRGWNVAGNDTVYGVWLRPPGGEFEHVYSSDPATARPLLAGKRVTVVPQGGEFYLRVEGNRTTDRVRVPAANETASAGGLLFAREGDALVALFDDTRVRIAKRESYE